MTFLDTPVWENLNSDDLSLATQARLVFADYLEDGGRGEEAFTIRWCLKAEVWPHKRARSTKPRVAAPFAWAWFPVLVPQYYEEHPISAELPRLAYLSLAGARTTTPHRYYPSWQEAMDDLANGLMKLKELVTL